MTKWFRFYADAMRNPKVAALSDREFRLWVALLSAASENDGRLPPAKELKHLLNMRLDHLLSGLKRLISSGLIDALEQGYEPHHWEKFQYKSDSSTERVHKHRAQRNVSETPPDTETEQRQKKEPIERLSSPPARDRFEVIQNQLLEAAGLGDFRAERNPKLMDLSPIFSLIDKGYPLESDILPAIRDKAAAGVVFQSWAYIVPVVIERANARAAIPPKAVAPSIDWVPRLKAWHESRTWGAWGPKPGEPGCQAPPELLRERAA